jgi:hypothetical protein
MMIRRRDPRFATVGDRLLPTAIAVIEGVVSPGQKGTFVGFGRASHNLIRVLRDGRKYPDRYHYRYWRRAQTEAEKAAQP